MKKEIIIAKEERFSKRRTLVIFCVIIFWIVSLMIVWGGMIHKNTGISPNDFDLKEEGYTL